MSQENVETLRAAYEAFSRRGWDALTRIAHPDFELKVPDRFPVAGTYRGPEEARRFFAEFLEPFDEVIVEPERFFEQGNRIVVFLLLRHRPKASSAVADIRIGHLWTMRDGKVARLEIFPEREEALEAVGLSE